MIFLCSRFSSTASSPAHKARALFPVPARPPSETIPMVGSCNMSMASRCSALRPCNPNRSRSPRTSSMFFGPTTRANAEPRSECTTRLVFRGRSSTRTVRSSSFSYSFCISSPDNEISATPVHPESVASSARYSSAASPMLDALTRSGRSFDTTTTSSPSFDRLSATDRIRVSLSPRRSPDGRAESLVWLSSTRSVPPSPIAIGMSRRSCVTRKLSRNRRACRAKYPSSGSLRFFSNSDTTTTGRTTSCSANRNIARGSDNRTDVSNT